MTIPVKDVEAEQITIKALEERIEELEKRLASLTQKIRESEIELRGGLLHIVSHVERSQGLNRRVPRDG